MIYDSLAFFKKNIQNTDNFFSLIGKARIYEYANISHFNSLTAGFKMFSTLLKSVVRFPHHTCVNCTLAHTWPPVQLQCCKVLLVCSHTEVRFKMTAERLSLFRQQPVSDSAVIVLHSEAQTYE